MAGVEKVPVADAELDAENNSLVPVKNISSKALIAQGVTPSKAVMSAEPHAGDESMSVKPWKGAVREPSGWKEPDFLGEAPNASLEMKFVYGYRGWDCRNNIGFAGSRHLITYHVAGVGIVANTQTHTQIHNTEHNNDIICLDVHPDGHMVATGEIGHKPIIVLWDAYTGVTIRVLKYHTRGVSNVSFSKSGALLISVGMDTDHMIAVHNVNTGALVGKGKAGKGVDVLTISVGYGDSQDFERFVSGAKGHIKFWELPSASAAGGELSCKSGIYNNKAIKCRTIVSSAFLLSDCVTGMSDGTLVLWKDRCATRFVNAHKGAVMAICELGGRGSTPGASDTGRDSRIISGGKDGVVHIWSYKLAKMWSLDLGSADTMPMSVNSHIRAVSTYENRLLVGTKGSEIYEVNLLANSASSSAAGNSGSTSSIYRLVEGHYDDRAEVWALAIHPLAGTNKFITGGDDMTVRLYDSKAMTQIAMVNVSKKVRALAWRPDGSHIAVGCYDGRVKILTSNLQTLVAEVSPSSKWIACMTYSPDGQHLVVGSHDTHIYLLDTKSYSVRTVFKGNSGAVTHLDWSEDNDTIQSASGAYELLFWSAKDAKQIKSATGVRDVKWKNWTSILGWPVQGIWPSGADFSDVNSCDRSPNQRLLTTADDNHRIKLFEYPVPKEASKCKGQIRNVLALFRKS
jgi:microtubule-associated protein-like 6